MATDIERTTVPSEREQFIRERARDALLFRRRDCAVVRRIDTPR